MCRLFPTLNIYVLWLVDVMTTFIGSCFVLHYQTMPGCMGMSSVLDCCNMQLNNWLTFTPIIVGIFLYVQLVPFCFCLKRRKNLLLN